MRMMNQIASRKEDKYKVKNGAEEEIRSRHESCLFLVRLASPINCAVRCAWAEISCLLQAFEVVQHWLGHGWPVRFGDVFNENNFSRLVLRNAPEPGVRNDGANKPGKTRAAIPDV